MDRQPSGPELFGRLHLVDINLTNLCTLSGVVLLLALAGCATDKCHYGDCRATTHEQTTMNKTDPQATQQVVFNSGSQTPTEKVNGLTYDGKQVSAKVVSHGCTHQDHFTIEHVVQQGQCYATVVRTKPDLCKRAPMSVEITIPWSRPVDCESSTIVFTNPLLEAQSVRKSVSKTLPDKSSDN